MKKQFLTLVLALLAAVPLFAQEEEIMIIKPGRETFAHFPSSVLGGKHTLTVFLPEPFVPLKGRYPLAVLLGAGPKQAGEAAAYMRRNKAIVAAVNFEEADYAQQEKIVRFVSRELLPYLETNYPVLAGTENRVIAARGAGGARTAFALLAGPELFGGVSLSSPGDAWQDVALPKKPFRAFVTGTQAELAAAQRAFENAGLVYGPGFALEYEKETSPWFRALPADYLFAPAADLAVTRFSADASDKELSLNSGLPVFMRVLARLKNGRTYDYVPVSLRISPMYLGWDASSGTFGVLAGAEAGPVKIRPVVDKPSFLLKIRLKK